MGLERDQLIDDRYRLLARVGSGGMAAVWCADDNMLGRRVALKFLHERFAQDHQFVERFRREATAAAGLQHPNVVGVYDRGEWEGSHYIAMEYVEGASLKELIGDGLTVGEAVEIVRQVLAGARFAHGRGIIHRDLKPQNVLVNAEGRAMVADFGIARAGVSEITQTGSVLGTAQYLSPEQAQGLEVTFASDLYSVGVILYEALTGRVPFDAETPVAIALKQISERPRPPSEINPQVSRALDAVVLRALAKDPKNRFATADEFLHALDAAEADPEGGALGDTAAYGPAAGAGLAGLAAAGAAGAAAAAAAGSEGERAAGAGGGAEDATGAGAAGAGAGGGGAAAAGAGGGAAGGEGASGGGDGPGDGDAGGDGAAEAAEAGAAGGWMTRRRAAVIGGLALLLAGVGAWALTRPAQVIVPAVVQKSEKQAREQLDEKGFDVAVEEFPNCAPENSVTEQSPKAGTAADEGSTVTITVSLGQQSRVPAVAGLPQRKAIERLKRAELLVSPRPVANERVRAGEAIGTKPDEHAKVDCNEQVVLLVSEGPSLTTVPDVVGSQEAEARSLLEEADLRAEVEVRNGDEPEGTVISQSPSAGKRLRQGSRVTLAVSNGEGSVIAPNVVGKHRDSAVSALTSRGLDVRIVERATESDGEDDLVLEQTPQGGSRLPSGSEVTIFVGVFQPPPDEPPPPDDEPPPDEEPPPDDEPPPDEEPAP